MSTVDLVDSPTIRYYDENACAYVARTRELDLRDAYSRFLPHVRPGGRILDVGAGSGRDLKVFADMGYVALGIDPSEQLATYASQFSSCDCTVASVESMHHDATFDGIWACASLLHIRREALPAAVARLCGALRRGGALYASVRHGSGTRRHPDGRLYCDYTLDEFASVMSADRRLSIVDAWVSDDAQDATTQQWLNMIARREPGA